MVIAEVICGLAAFIGGTYIAFDKREDMFPRVCSGLAGLCGLGFAILAF